MPYVARTLTTDGLDIHTLTLGDSTDTLFFLHGWGGSVESFRAIGEELHETTGFRIVLFDQPGFGESTPPSEAWDSPRYAQFLAQFLDEHFPDAKRYFYAHSFGGKTLCHYLFKNPHGAEKIILSGSAGIVLPRTLRQRFARFVSFLLRPFQVLFPPRWRRRIGARLSGSHDWANATPIQRETLKLVLNEPDFRDQLSQIKVPTLIFWGAKDTYTRLPAAEIFHRGIRTSTLHVFPDGRHGLHYTHVAQIVPLATAFLCS